jgi:hypothetical protein
MKRVREKAPFGNFKGKGRRKMPKRKKHEKKMKKNEKKKEKGSRKSSFWQFPRSILKATEGKNAKTKKK